MGGVNTRDSFSRYFIRAMDKLGRKKTIKALMILLLLMGCIDDEITFLRSNNFDYECGGLMGVYITSVRYCHEDATHLALFWKLEDNAFAFLVDIGKDKTYEYGWWDFDDNGTLESFRCYINDCDSLFDALQRKRDKFSRHRTSYYGM